MVSFKSNQVCEFGDFQTPDDLACQATQVLKQLNIEPQAVLEPTCGSGSFIFAAMESFSQAQKFIGIDIRESHLDKLHQRLTATRLNTPVRTICANFFDIISRMMLLQLGNTFKIIPTLLPSGIVQSIASVHPSQFLE